MVVYTPENFIGCSSTDNVLYVEFLFVYLSFTVLYYTFGKASNVPL